MKVMLGESELLGRALAAQLHFEVKQGRGRTNTPTGRRQSPGPSPSISFSLNF